MRALLIAFLVACGGGSGGDVDPQVDAPDNLPACTMATYDSCSGNADCTSGNCHLFMQDGFQVCTTACTPLDNSTCPVDSTGANGECNMRGICKPAAENACAP